jgi:callose synthase
MCALLLLISFTCWWCHPSLHVNMKFFSIFIFLVAYDNQIRSLEALQKLFEQFPGAFMDTLHVALPNRCCFWYVTFSCFVIFHSVVGRIAVY